MIDENNPPFLPFYTDYQDVLTAMERVEPTNPEEQAIDRFLHEKVEPLGYTQFGADLPMIEPEASIMLGQWMSHDPDSLQVLYSDNFWSSQEPKENPLCIPNRKERRAIVLHSPNWYYHWRKPEHAKESRYKGGFRTANSAHIHSVGLRRISDLVTEFSGALDRAYITVMVEEQLGKLIESIRLA